MTSHQDSISIVVSTDQSSTQQRLSAICKRLFEILTHYDTPKVVRFESKWIAGLSLFVKLSLAISCICLMCQRSSYQIFDRSPISAVTIKVKPSSNCSSDPKIMRHFPDYNCTQSTYDVNDFILPPTENSAVTITTRVVEFGHILQNCDTAKVRTNQTNFLRPYTKLLHECYDKARCILPPSYRSIWENNTIVRKPQLCWFKLSKVHVKRNYQALDYVLFIKHYVEFPQLNLVRNNLMQGASENYTQTCEYDPDNHPLCPKFRILKILQLIEVDPKEYELMLYYGSLIEIKISWKCDLDKPRRFCEPKYQFERLDHKPYDANPYQPGSTFLTAKHFFGPNDRRLHRVHTNIYNLHIVVSVTGEVGKFDLFQATTSIGSFLGIFGAGTIVCDLIAAFFTNFKTIKYDG
ncbi:unnamed protein product [Adineta ricciae]|uniref:Uncharacterized protein n=1 Tax=Adineta ricciae TaxID=249248 RepID=A0A813QV44_ADIRI|nr:unnamed protein product [Adineta ricciae]